MQCPLVWPNNVPVWIFVVIAILAHARGVALLTKAVLSWLTNRKRRSRSE